MLDLQRQRKQMKQQMPHQGLLGEQQQLSDIVQCRVLETPTVLSRTPNKPLQLAQM